MYNGNEEDAGEGEAQRYKMVNTNSYNKPPPSVTEIQVHLSDEEEQAPTVCPSHGF